METQVIRPTKLAHVVLRTARYQELIDWYQLVLGAEITFGNPMATFLYYDDEHHRLAILNMPHLPPHTRAMPGVDHVAFTYASLGDLLSNYERLRDAGVEAIWSVNHGATTSLYYKDPDDNVVELQVDNFASREETDAFLRDGRFAINPIGIDFDPEEMLARHRAGEDAKQLTRWPDEVTPRTTPPPAEYLG
ncbi:MAG: VOC family protein [Myxococcota bacterium]|nr:VOC family protein [Myxococcota bacterium]